MKWNAHINLTAVRDPEEVITRHFGESLFAARQLLSTDALQSQTAIDVGSGAGFPGLPLKIWNPELTLTLIEANQKESRVSARGCPSLGSFRRKGRCRPGRKPPEQASLVVLRAVERFEKTLPVAAKLVAPSRPLRPPDRRCADRNRKIHSRRTSDWEDSACAPVVARPKPACRSLPGLLDREMFHVEQSAHDLRHQIVPRGTFAMWKAGPILSQPAPNSANKIHSACPQSGIANGGISELCCEQVWFEKLGSPRKPQWLELSLLPIRRAASVRPRLPSI